MDRAIEQVFEHLIHNSVAGGLLGLLVLAAIHCSRGRLGPVAGVALTSVVFVRLLLPVTPEIPGGMLPAGGRIFVEGVNFETDPAPRFEDSTPLLPASVPISELPVPIIEDGVVWLEEFPEPVVAELSEAGKPEKPTPPAPAPSVEFEKISIPALSMSIPSLPVLVWIGGGVILALLAFLGQARLRLHVRRSGRKPRSSLVALLRDCRRELGVRKHVRIRVVAGIPSASLFGLWRPQLLIPPGLESELSLEETRAVFLHELAHLKRGDLWWNWFGFFVLCLHWFNPLVWLLVGRFRADREQLCDRLAVRSLSDFRLYSATLLKLVRSSSGPSRSPIIGPVQPGLASIFTRKSEIKQRIVMIHQKPGIPHAIRVTVFALLGLAAMLTFPPASADDEREGRKAPPEAREGDRERPERDIPRGGDREKPERGAGREGDLPRDGDRGHPERGDGRVGDRPREGDREHPERGRDRDHPEAREIRRDGDREHPERGRDRDHPEAREIRRDGDREHPEGHDRPNEEQVRAAEAEMRKMHQAMEEAMRSGRREEANMIERRIDELRHALSRSLERGQPQRREHHGDAEARLHHLNLAAENLERAGMREEAARYREQAERLRHEIEGANRRHGPENERAEKLEHEVRELHEIIGDLKREIEELHEQLEISRKR